MKLMLQDGRITHFDTISHDGKIVAIARADDGTLWYTVRRNGFENTARTGPTRQYWEDLQSLPLPGASDADDPSVLAYEERSLSLPLSANSSISRSHRSLYQSQSLGAIGRPRLLSHNGILHVFRQTDPSAAGAGALVVDRFVLDGLSNKLVRKLEVRFKRSRQRFQAAGDDSDAVADSLDFRDANQQPFYEPSIELSFLGHDIAPDWWDLELVPTTEHDRSYWHIAWITQDKRRAFMASVASSEERLFDTRDRNGAAGLAFTEVELNGRLAGGSPALAKFDKQREQQNEDGQTRLVRQSTHLMLTLPMSAPGATEGDTLATEFDLHADGRLQMHHETLPLAQETLRADLLDVPLPLDTLEDIKGIGLGSALRKADITAMHRHTVESIRVEYELPGGGDLSVEAPVKLRDTPLLKGRYRVSGIAFGELSHDLERDDIAVKVSKPLTDRVPPGLRLNVLNTRGRVVGTLTTAKRRSGSRPGSRQIGIEDARFRAKKGYRLQCIDAFEISAQTDLGEILELPAEDEQTLFAGQITGIEALSGGRVRVHAFDHGLLDDHDVRLDGVPQVSGAFDVQESDDGLLLGSRWPAAEAVNLTRAAEQRRGLHLASGAEARLPLPKGPSLISRQATFECWLRTAGPGRLLGHDGFALEVNQDGGLVLSVGSTEMLSAEHRVDDDHWHHLALTVSDGRPRALFVDALDVTSRQADATLAADALAGWSRSKPSAAEQLRLGGRGSVALSDLRVWERVLDDSELDRQRFLWVNGNELGLMGSWRLGAILEGETRQLIDNTPNQQHGSCSASAYITAQRLHTTLADGHPVVRFQNDELVGVVAGATYEEIVELRAESGQQILDAAALQASLAPYFSGRRSRNSADEIPHEDFELLSMQLEPGRPDGWYRLISRFRMPQNVLLFRAFGLKLLEGAAVSDLSVRGARLRMLNSSISRADYRLPLKIPTSQSGQVPASVVAKELREHEAEECRLANEIKRKQWELQRLEAPDLAKRVETAKQDMDKAERWHSSRETALRLERDDPLNRVCFLESQGRYLRVYSQETSTKGRHQILSSNKTTTQYPNYLWSLDRSTGVFHSQSKNKVMAMFGDAFDYEMYGVDYTGIDEQRWLLKPIAGSQSRVLVNKKWRRIPQKKPGDNSYHMRGSAQWSAGSRAAGFAFLAIRFVPTAQESRYSLIPAARKARDQAWQDYLREKRTFDDLARLARDLEANKARVRTDLQILDRRLRDVRSHIASRRAVFNSIVSVNAEPLAGNGKALRTWALRGVWPHGPAQLSDRSDGQVVLSYSDADGALTQARYAAAATSGNPDFETWRTDRLRHCIDLPDSGVLVLDPEVGGDAGDVSVEMWVRLPCGLDDSMFLSCADRSQYLHSFFDAKAGQWPMTLGGLHQLAVFEDVAAGWHHLAFVCRGAGSDATTRIYVDGALKADLREYKLAEAAARADSEPDEEKKKAIVDAAKEQTYRLTSPIRYIGNHGHSTGYSPGLLAEVRVWNIALTDEEVEINSRTLLTGREPGLVHYFPLDTHGLSIAGKRQGRLQGADFSQAQRPWSAQLGQLSANGRRDAPVTTLEYSAALIDPDTRQRSAMLRRLYATVSADHGLELLAQQRVEELELVWIGNAQFEPTLLGYIEGAPPVPSENLTELVGAKAYMDATSVQLQADSELSLSWQRDQNAGLGLDLDVFFGSKGKFTVFGTEFGDYKVGFKGALSLQYSFLNASQVGASAGQSITDRVSLRGNMEKHPRFPHLGRRFVPKNVGYALVVSGLADVYISRLRHTGTMIGYEVLPSPDVPPDVNTITFMINPALTMAGSLDGLTGSRPTSERYFRHVPAMRSQMGSKYPASYLRIDEAYALQADIEREDREREAFFANFNSLLVDESSLNREVGDDVDEDEVDAQAEDRRKELERQGQDSEEAVDATAGFAGWQARMEDLAVKAGKQNIVNTYVWDADGGLRTQQQRFAETVRHTIGGTFSLSGKLGFTGEGSLFGTAAGLTALATVHMTQTMTKARASRRAMALAVDLGGVESRGVTDYRDRPLNPGEKVDRYRFKSFYLSGKTDHFYRFFSEVVDPEWLASNDEEARALRQIDQSRPNKCWRVMHRVTYVERPALLDFGNDVRTLDVLPGEAEVALEDLNRQLAELNREVNRVRLSVNRLARKVDADDD